MVAAEEYLPQPSPLIVCVPSNKSVYHPDEVQRLSALTAELAEAGMQAGNDGWSVRSILTESLPSLEDDVLVFKRVSAMDGSGLSLERALDEYPSLRQLFCPNANAWFLYVYPKHNENLRIMLSLSHIFAAYPGISVVGPEWVNYQSSLAMRRDILIILPLSVLILFLVFLIWEKAGRYALILTIASLLPTIGTIALYPVFGHPLKSSTILAPVLVLVLSSTYVIHVYHHFRHRTRESLVFLRDRGEVILWSGITTLLGFASLLLSPIPDLHTNGVFVLCGMLLAFFWDLLVLPLVFSGRENAEVRTAITQESIAPDRQTKRQISRIAFLLPFLVCIPGLFFMKTYSSGFLDFFTSSYDYSRELRRFESFMPLVGEVSLFVDSTVEGGLTNPAFFNETFEFAKAVRSHRLISSVYAYSDPVLETARVLGRPNAIESDVGIGEILELLPIDIETPRFYDLGYRVSLIRIGLVTELGQGEELDSVLREIERMARNSFPGSSVTAAGFWPRYQLSLRGLVSGQISGLISYFAVVFILVLIRIRNVGKSLIVCAVPLSAILAVLGICGYLGWEISPTICLSLAALSGVGIDDAFLWSFYSNKPKFRSSVFGTTVIIIMGLSPMILSFHVSLIRGAIVAMIGFALSTFFVLKVLPWKKQ